MPTQVLMNNVCIVCTMEESDRFMGQKADGFVYLPSVEALHAFEKHIAFHRSLESYSTILDRKLVALNSAGIAALAEAVEDDQKRQWLWTHVDYSIKLW